MANERVGGSCLSSFFNFLCDWPPFRKVRGENFTPGQLDELKIGLLSANDQAKDEDEEQRIKISDTAEVSSKHGESEHRQRKVLFIFRRKKVNARSFDKLKIGLPSENKPQKDADEEQSISSSGTSDGSSDRDEFEHQPRKVGEKAELIVDDRIDAGDSENVICRPVSAKCLNEAHDQNADSYKIRLLMESNHHPNLIRFHDGTECDKDFFYNAMESCKFISLDDLVQVCSPRSLVTEQPNARLESLKKIVGDVKLVAENGHPSPLLLKLMWEILSVVSHLHDKLCIIHGHLSPRSILIDLEGSVSRLEKGCGNSDWRASIPHHGHQTWEKDMYDLGEIFCYCITGERKTVDENKIGLSMVDCPEALNLISLLLNLNPRAGPKAIELLQHPLFWNSEKRLSFLRDTSERVGDSQYSNLLKELRKVAVKRIIVGESSNENQCQTWKEKIDDSIISHMDKYLKKKQKIGVPKMKKKQRKGYDYCSVRDLIRFIRNMMAHYGQLPKHIQQSVGTLHNGFDGYFASRFPKLLIEVYECVCKCCKEDEYFRRYFNGNVVL